MIEEACLNNQTSVLSVDDRINFVEDQILFSQLSMSDIKSFVVYLSVKSFPKDSIIISEGERQSSMAFLVKGQVSIVKEDEKGADKKITQFNKGKVFGEMSLLDGQPSSASVIAQEDVVLMLLTEKQFNILTKEHPKLAVKLLLILSKTLSGRLRMTSGRLVDYLD